jgi:NitT/TauT family transport system permease protein
VTARFGSLRESLLPFAIAANSVPIIAFAPIFNNWFGIANPLSKAMIAAVLCFFPVMINTVRGLRNVDPAALELMRSYAAGELEVFRRVRVPNALPFVFTALRLATTLATIGAIVGEYFGAPKVSLGQYVATAFGYLSVENAWAAIVFAAAIGIALYVAVVALERIVMPWYSAREVT